MGSNMVIKEAMKAYIEKRFSPEKADAITAEGENILLSAGAGCGKTTALSYRVLYQVLALGLSVNDMLILTFTNNAAAEMKERIQELLIQAADDASMDFLSQEDRQRLREEAAKVPTAFIATFDSYSGQLVRRYADLLHVDPSYTNLSEPVQKFVFHRILDQVLSEKFSVRDPELIKYYNQVSDTDGTKLRTRVDLIESLRQTFRDFDSFFKGYRQNFATPERVAALFGSAVKYLLLSLRRWNNKFDRFTSAFASDSNRPQISSGGDFFPAVISYVNQTIESVSQLNETDPSSAIAKLKNDLSVENISFAYKKKGLCRLNPSSNKWKSQLFEQDKSSPQYKELDSYIEGFKKILGDIDDILAVPAVKVKVGEQEADITPEDFLLRYENEMASQLEFLYSIDVECHQRLECAKARMHKYTFSDIKTMALKLLHENEDIREAERFRIHSIMVDEYQDSDDVQEELLRILGTDEKGYKASLTGAGKEAETIFNRRITFMVGDVKQSIYGFRNARPELFLGKYDNPMEHNCRVIAMTDNYRSTPSVIDLTNHLFKRVMTKDETKIDYAGDRKQQLVQANASFNGCPADGITVLDSTLQKGDFFQSLISIPAHGDHTAEQRQQTFKMIAQTIEKIMSKPSAFLLRNKKGKDVQISYSSFCILLRAKTDVDSLTRELGERSIPFKLDLNITMSQSSPALLSGNLLRLESILFKLHGSTYPQGCNLKQDLNDLRRSIASLERSFADRQNEKTVIEMCNLVPSERDNLSNAEILKRLRRIPVIDLIEARINSDPALAMLRPLEVYRRLLDLLRFEEKLAAGKRTEKLYQAADWTFSKIQELSDMGYGLSDIADFFFSDYAEDDIQKVNSSTADAVTITNIHKSKGLEYPIVLMPLIPSRDEKLKLTRGGLSTNTQDLTIDETYGAHTDVKELTYEEGSQIKMLCPLTKKTDIRLAPFYCLREQEEISQSEEEARLLYVAVTRAIDRVLFFTCEDLAKMRNFSYNRPATPAKWALTNASCLVLKDYDEKNYTLSALSTLTDSYPRRAPGEKIKIILDPDVRPSRPAAVNASAKPEVNRASEGTTHIADYDSEERGTRLHAILALVDWSGGLSSPKLPAIALTKEEKRLVEAFLKSELLQERIKALAQGKKIEFYQERQYLDAASHATGSIDLLLTWEGGAAIIDYKTSDITNPAYQHQLEEYRRQAAVFLHLKPEQISCFLYSLIKREYREVK